MKSLFIWILSISFLIAQKSEFKPNTRLDANVSLANDTLVISSEKIITNIEVYRRLSFKDKVRAKIKPREYAFNVYKLPMSDYEIGTYTVAVNLEGDIYPFTLKRLEEINKPVGAKRWIVSYEIEYKIVKNIGSYKGSKKVGKQEISNMLNKFSDDQVSINGIDNSVKLYAIFNDHTKSLIYEIN